MKGSTHRKFAPIFTLGASIVAVRSGYFDMEFIPDFLKLVIPTAASTLTSMAPDADLHAFKPMYVIMDTYPKRKHKGKYYVRNKKGEVKEYTVPKGYMRYWAVFFKIIGASHHRCFKSHGPTLWIPLWFLFYLLVYYATTVISGFEHNLLSAFLCLISFGLGAGYISHLIGDLFTKSGLPLTPKQDISPAKILLGEKGSSLTKASSKTYNAIFLFFATEVLFFIIDSDKAMTVNKEAIMLVATWIPTLLGYLVEFLALFKS